MGPYDASADRAINITLHRREIDLLKVSEYESAGRAMTCGGSVLDCQHEPCQSRNTNPALREGKERVVNGEIVVDLTRRTVQALAMSRV